jgi:hypothetical protein
VTSNEIAIRDPHAVDSWAAVMPDVIKLSQHLEDTEFVPKTLRGRPAAIAAAILAGREAGIGPMRSLSHMHIVDGRPSMSAEQKRAQALAAGHEIVYVETSTTRCKVKGRRRGSEQWSEVTWTTDDAKAAKLDGKDNWRKWPRRMLQARATGELCDMLFPDATAGLATYEELVDDSDAVGVQSNGEVPKKRTARRQTTVQNHANHGDREDATSENHASNQPNHAEPGPPLPGEDGYEEVVKPTPADNKITPPQRAKMLALFNNLGITERQERLHISAAVVNREVDTANKLTRDEASALIDTLETVSREDDPRAALDLLLAEEAQLVIEEAFDAEVIDDGT